MTPSLPPGYSIRAPTLEDAEEVADLIAGCEMAEGDQPQRTAEEVREDWMDIGLADEAVMITDPSGRLAAYADLSDRGHVRISVYGYVHPDFIGRGLGSVIVRWGAAWTAKHLDRAPAGSRVVVEHYIRSTNAAARALMEAHGYDLVRTVYVMAEELDTVPGVPEVEGISIRRYKSEEDEQSLFDVGEEAFADMWDRAPSTLERWTSGSRLPSFDPGLWLLAQEDGTGSIAGFAMGQRVPGTENGWVNSLGVRRAYRGRGVGLFLLTSLFAAFFERGIRYVELSVDAESPTGAPRLYRRAGMEVSKSFHIYRREIRSATPTDPRNGMRG
jgi:mycothiol synthase